MTGLHLESFWSGRSAANLHFYWVPRWHWCCLTGDHTFRTIAETKNSSSMITLGKESSADGVFSEWVQLSRKCQQNQKYFLVDGFMYQHKSSDDDTLSMTTDTVAASIEIPYLYLYLRQRKAGKVWCESMSYGSWGENKSLFSLFVSQSISQYPTYSCTKGHRSRESNTKALKPFKFVTVQRQNCSWHWISCIRTVLSNHLGKRTFEIEGVCVNLASLFLILEF